MPGNSYIDQEITCADCGEPFPWTAQDQEFYAEKGYSAPKRCKGCRATRKAERAQQEGYS